MQLVAHCGRTRWQCSQFNEANSTEQATTDAGVKHLNIHIISVY